MATRTLYKQHNVHTRQALTLAVAPDTPLSNLPPKHPTPKRNEVLRLHLAGLRRAQIARETGLSPNAVNYHLRRIRCRPIHVSPSGHVERGQST